MQFADAKAFVVPVPLGPELPLELGLPSDWPPPSDWPALDSLGATFQQVGRLTEACLTADQPSRPHQQQARLLVERRWLGRRLEVRPSVEHRLEATRKAHLPETSAENSTRTSTERGF